MRVALFFGSFNPLHNGHLAIAGYVLGNTDAEALWLVLSPHNPHKNEASLASFSQRADYISRVIEHVGDARLTLCSIEDSLPRPSYTWYTLRQLQRLYPEHEFSIVMGGDSLAMLRTWKRGEDILEAYPLLVYPRLGEKQPDSALLQHRNVRLLNAPQFDISSTYIRGAYAEGQNVAYYLPIPLR